MTTILELPDDLPSSTHMTLDEIRTELAIALYASRRLSIGKAHELAQMPLWQFRQLLASRRISVDLTPDDLDEELSTLHRLNRQ